jgi:cytochrome c oxidase subunit 2
MEIKGGSIVFSRGAYEERKVLFFVAAFVTLPQKAFVAPTAGFQFPATEDAINMFKFHDDLMLVVIFIFIFVMTLLAVSIFYFKSPSAVISKKVHGFIKKSRLNHDSTIESVFTIIPAIVVFLIAVPSFSLLYTNSDSEAGGESNFEVHVTGNQ